MAASSTISCSNFNPKHNSPLERRPRMLKDFLHDDSNSSSSNGFKSFPRKSSQIYIISRENLNNGTRLERSRSKAASATISAFQAMINAIKSIHFASSVKYSPSILLPRSLSRKLSTRNSQSQLNVGNKITVTVKDIIRWKSFRDIVEEESRPSDFAPSSPHHCTTATTTATTTGSNTPCSSNGSSWCDSDFTSEYSPSDVYGENEVAIADKKHPPCVGRDPMETKTTTKTADNTDMGPKSNFQYANEETEQRSPVSVLDLEYSEDEAKAWQLVNLVKETIPLTSCDKLLLDLFREGVEYCETVKLVKAWIDGGRSETTKREGCVRELERDGRWRNCRFEEEEELAMVFERWVINILVNELLVDLL